MRRRRGGELSAVFGPPAGGALCLRLRSRWLFFPPRAGRNVSSPDRRPARAAPYFFFCASEKETGERKRTARGGQSIPLWTPPNASPAGVRRQQRPREPGSTHTFARRSRRTFFGSKDKMARQLRRAGSDGSISCVQTIIGAASPPPLDRLSVVRSARSEDVRDEDRAFMTERGEDERIGGVQRGGPPPLAFFFFSPFLFSHGRKRKGALAEQAARAHPQGACRIRKAAEPPTAAQARTQHTRPEGGTNIIFR